MPGLVASLEAVQQRLRVLEEREGIEAPPPPTPKVLSTVRTSAKQPQAKPVFTGSAKAAAEGESWEPMWPRPHRGDHDAIFGLALGYRLRDYERFVGSLRKVGFTGDVVLAVVSGHPVPTALSLHSLFRSVCSSCF